MNETQQQLKIAPAKYDNAKAAYLSHINTRCIDRAVELGFFTLDQRTGYYANTTDAPFTRFYAVKLADHGRAAGRKWNAKNAQRKTALVQTKKPAPVPYPRQLVIEPAAAYVGIKWDVLNELVNRC